MHISDTACQLINNDTKDTTGTKDEIIMVACKKAVWETNTWNYKQAKNTETNKFTQFTELALSFTPNYVQSLLRYYIKHVILSTKMHFCRKILPLRYSLFFFAI